jgi:GNAT superfamily N-acetyltransferase
MVTVQKAPADSPEAIELMRELSDFLLKLTGRSGEASFRAEDMDHPRAVFAIAYADGEPLGCGAIREFEGDTAELKRMYAREKSRGVGGHLISFLEAEAARLGYKRIVLETGTVNEKAVRFYLSNGYSVCENFGKYVGRDDSVCLDKLIL